MNPRQQKFVDEFLIDKNGTQAAKRAEYKGTDAVLAITASKLLRVSKVKLAIEAGLAKQAAEVAARQEETVITKARWLDELNALALSNSTDFFAEANGTLTMSIADIKKRGLGRLISEMTVLPGGKIKFKLHSKMGALEMIAKHFGWIKDIHKHEGEIGTPNTLSKDQFKQIFSDPKAMEAALVLAERIAPPPALPGKGEKK